jgi:hypothetical protein
MRSMSGAEMMGGGLGVPSHNLRHMYGWALAHLPNRVTFHMAEGAYIVFPASPNIREAR